MRARTQDAVKERSPAVVNATRSSTAKAKHGTPKGAHFNLLFDAPHEPRNACWLHPMPAQSI